MSNAAQPVELEGGNVDRPWGHAFAGFAKDKHSGQVAVVEGDRTYIVAFAAGAVVGARSPLATDAAVRVARLANLISPTQVSTFVRKHGASPIGDDLELVIEHAALSPAQAAELRRRVVAHRAARTFSVERGTVMLEPTRSIDAVAGCSLDARAIIYLGARQNLSEHRLSDELAKLGDWFRLAATAELDGFGFGDAERAPLERLRDGATLFELETCVPGIELRMVRAMIYALCAAGACESHPAKPEPKRRLAEAIDPDQLLAPRVEGLLAPKVVELDDLMSEHAELPAPVVVDLPRPVTRGRTDTLVDGQNRVDLVGVVVDGRYVLERKLGEGAMGAVYLAHHTRLDRMFAVKVLHRRLLENPKSRKRFEREAELTGRLAHENVVRVVDVGTVHGLPYLAMEFAEGASLATVMVDAPLPAPRATHLLAQLCAGLHHAHEAGLIHRDLKPSNVIVESTDSDEIVRIVDFGIAILAEPDGGERLTTRGVVLGTPDYMAPELAAGKPIDRRLDLYALGVIAYELFTGVRPFDGDGVDVALANANTPAPPMRERAPKANVDPLHEALVRKLLEKDPAARPTDAQEVARLLGLIEKDRSAAAVALGIDHESRTKTQAMWQLERPPAELQIVEQPERPVSSSRPPPLEHDAARPVMARSALRISEVLRATGQERPSTHDLATDEIRPVSTGWPIVVGVALLMFLAIVTVVLAAP